MFRAAVSVSICRSDPLHFATALCKAEEGEWFMADFRPREFFDAARLSGPAARDRLKGRQIMSEHHTGPVETGAPMNYAEHEKTYGLFVAGAKYGTVVMAALMIGMAAGFFTAAGFLGGLVVFLVLTLVGIFLLR